MEGQITLDDYFAGLTATWTCQTCICNGCLYWWSERCPYGECWDEERARISPYDKAHPDRPPRTGWSNWETDQAYWCRGGVFYPAHYCKEFVNYTGYQCKECLETNVCVYQDGYIRCSVVDTIGCDVCYQTFMERQLRILPELKEERIIE